MNINPEAQTVDMMSVSGKMAVQPVAVQHEFYDEIEHEYNLLIEDMKEQGTYDLDVKDQDYQAELRDRQIITVGKNEQNPFGQSTWLERLRCRALRQPLKLTEIQKRIEQHLDGKTPQEKYADLIQALDQDMAAYLQSLAQQTEAAEDDATRERYARLDRNARVAQAEIKADLSYRGFRIGQTYHIDLGNDLSMDGVLIRLRNDRGAGNPAQASRFRLTFAVNNGMQTYTVPLSRLAVGIEMEKLSDSPPADWDKQLPSDFREERFMLTGNLVQGFADAPLGATIVRFTMKGDEVREGILMPLTWKPKDRAGGDTVRVTADQAQVILLNGRPLSGRIVKLFQQGRQYAVATPKAKGVAGVYFQDPELQGLTVRGDFESKGNEMRATVDSANLPRFLRRVYELGDTFDIPRKLYDELLADKQEAQPQEQAPKADRIQSLQTAYEAVKAQSDEGFSDVSIIDLYERFNKLHPISLDGFKLYLKELGREGQAVFSLGDWSLSDERTRSGVIEMSDPASERTWGHGRRNLLVRFKSLSAQYSTGRPSTPPRSVTLADVKAAFPGMEVGEVDGAFWIRTGKSRWMVIDKVESVDMDHVSFQASYGRDMRPGERAAGSYRAGLIQLDRITGDKWVLRHEQEHWLEDTGLLTPADIFVLKARIQALTKQGKFTPENPQDVGGSEDRANYVAHMIEGEKPAGALGRIWEKIKEWIDRLVNLFQRTAGGVARDIKSGKVLKGQAQAPGNNQSSYSLGRAKPAPDLSKILAGLPDDVAKRLVLAHGLPVATRTDRVKAMGRDIFKTFTRHHKTLDSKKYGDAADLIRQLEEVPQIAIREATDALIGISKGLGSQENLRLFSYMLVMDDMVKDMEPGGILEAEEALPFGFTRPQAEAFHAHLQKLVGQNKEVREALKKRRDYMKALRDKLVKAKLLKPEALKDDRYFHHQVLMHRAAKELGESYQNKPGTSSKDARLHKKGWQIARKGSLEDYNTAYFESEFEVVAQAEAQLRTAKISDKIQSLYDLRSKLQGQAKKQNRTRFLELLRERGMMERDELGQEKDPLKPWKMKIAMANMQLAKLAASGTLKVDPIYDGLIEKLAQAYRQYMDAPKKERKNFPVGVEDERWLPFLSHLMQTNSNGAVWAGTVFRAIWDREAFIKEVLGKEEVSWQDLMPEGYTTWQPKPEGVWFTVNTLPDHVIERVRAGGELPEKISKAWARGTGQEWVVPEDLAATMDNIRPILDDNMLAKASAAVISGWKQWTLLNPFRVLRYNLNNMSGDADIVMAYDPKIFKYAGRAAADLYKQLRGRELSKSALDELAQAADLGVTSSGWAMQEVTDITQQLSYNEYMDAVTGRKPNLAQKYWNLTKEVTQLRENVLRLAAFRYFKDQIAAGRKPGKDIFGASNRQELASVAKSLSPAEAAAKMARELVGDYGNLTEAGQWIRRHMIPFYSWMEVNAPRYVRLMRNLKHEGKSTNYLTGAMAWKATKLGLKASALMAAVILWNMTFFPDEWDEMGDAKRRQLHLILGRHDDGSIRSIRFQGALSDALSWFGAEDIVSDIEDVTERKVPVLDKVGEALSAPFVKLWQGARPIEKMVAETVMGQSTYPDPGYPRPIRDRAEYIARTFSLDIPYGWIAGKPKRGDGVTGQLLHDVLSLGSYTTDTGETAYYDVKKWQRNFLDRYGVEKPSISPTSKGNALYYYKQALKFGDVDAAKVYLEKYYDLGGNRSGIKLSIKLSHPLGGLPKKMKGKFLNELNPKQYETYQRALDWYKRTYQSR